MDPNNSVIKRLWCISQGKMSWHRKKRDPIVLGFVVLHMQSPICATDMHFLLEASSKPESSKGSDETALMRRLA